MENTEKKIALAVIDMQNDFLTGSLGNEAGVTIIPEIVKRIKNKMYSKIIVTRDTHHDDYLTTQEGQKLPVAHCVENTEGWEIHDDIKAALAVRENDTEIFTIDKPTFGSIDLIKLLQNEFADYDEIHFCGVCTGICVISNIMIAKATLSETNICLIENACACITPESHKTAVDAIKMCQVDII